MNVPRSYLAPMKRLVPPSLDPLPRSISVKSLALLTAMLLSGVGISVRGYLVSRQPPGRTRPVAPELREQWTSEERSTPIPASSRLQPGTTEARTPNGERWSPPAPRPVAAGPVSAPSAFTPTDGGSDPAVEGRGGVSSER
jgi:hypothetical protein